MKMNKISKVMKINKNRESYENEQISKSHEN